MVTPLVEPDIFPVIAKLKCVESGTAVMVKIPRASDGATENMVTKSPTDRPWADGVCTVATFVPPLYMVHDAMGVGAALNANLAAATPGVFAASVVTIERFPLLSVTLPVTAPAREIVLVF